MSVEVPYIELKLSNKFLKGASAYFVEDIVDEILSVIVGLSCEQKRQIKDEITIISKGRKLVIRLNLNPLDYIWFNENIWNLSQKLCQDRDIKKTFCRNFNKGMREIIRFSYNTVNNLTLNERNEILSAYINIICIEVILTMAVENCVYTDSHLNMSLDLLKYEDIYTSLIDSFKDFKVERLIELINLSNQLSKLSL